MTKGYNLPDNVDPNDPEAPWNKDGQPGQDERDESEVEEEPEAICPDCGWAGDWDEAEETELIAGVYICPVCNAELDEGGEPGPGEGETPQFNLDEV